MDELGKLAKFSYTNSPELMLSADLQQRFPPPPNAEPRQVAEQ